MLVLGTLLRIMEYNPITRGMRWTRQRRARAGIAGRVLAREQIQPADYFCENERVGTGPCNRTRSERLRQPGWNPARRIQHSAC
jgi:hypothetical protein